MKNTTKKNLKNLITLVNNNDIFQWLIDQKADEWSVKEIVRGFKKSLDEQCDLILNK